MLRELHVRNLAVLASGSLELGTGLNVLTGETGAGKSLVVDSLALLAGARASTDLIRSGADGLTVTGVFAPSGEAWRSPLETAGVELDGDEVVVRREIGREGRNRVFVNDQPVTLRLLAELGPHLLRIHGQREELGLVAPDLQRAWLDRSGGPEAAELVARVASAHGVWRSLRERWQRLDGDARLRSERVELLRFQVAELEAARLVAGEEEGLRQDRDVLRHAEAIAEALGAANAALADDEDAALDRLARAESRLDGVAAWEPAAAGWVEELRDVRIRLAEVASALGHRAGELEPDPRRLDQIEERLALLERLARKHGGASGEMLGRLAAMREELAELDGSAEGREELAQALGRALASYDRAAVELTAARRRWAEGLATRLQQELTELALPHARFAVGLEPRRGSGSGLQRDGVEVEPGVDGVDQVVFLFSPNPGEEMRPLARAASGGELARVYLALQLAAFDEGAPGRPALVFDEVDSGVGGAEAAALGGKLQRLARAGQVLVVTHLPQVASHADHHFRVSKRAEDGRTHAAVETLARRARVDEVARMLAGERVTALSRSHAEELIRSASRAN